MGGVGVGTGRDQRRVTATIVTEKWIDNEGCTWAGGASVAHCDGRVAARLTVLFLDKSGLVLDYRSTVLRWVGRSGDKFRGDGVQRKAWCDCVSGLSGSAELGNGNL